MRLAGALEDRLPLDVPALMVSPQADPAACVFWLFFLPIINNCY